jgi:hypothetical protein
MSTAATVAAVLKCPEVEVCSLNQRAKGIQLRINAQLNVDPAGQKINCWIQLVSAPAQQLVPTAISCIF